MRTTLGLASLAALATFAAAQSTTIPHGYGRFPCTKIQPDGTLGPDSSRCADTALHAPGTGKGNQGGTQGDGVNPTGAECVLEAESGAYFCGIAGAKCDTDAQCDNGHCVNQKCQGGFTQPCMQNDANCLGFLYCLTNEYEATATDMCGGLGAFCNDADAASLDMQADEAEAIFSSFCNSGYCNYQTAGCDVKKLEGASCASDPDFGCAAGLTCSTDQICVRPGVGTGPSQRARSRRSLAHRGLRAALCPEGRSACTVDGAGPAVLQRVVPRGRRAYECVDVMTSLEQCGACAAQGGADCTALPGVAAVGCVRGACEIWACENGFTFSADAAACVAE